MPRLEKVGKERKFNESLGQAVRARRELLGMTQKYVAEKMGISYQQFQKYESGYNHIPIFRMKQISQILQTSFLEYIAQDLPDYDYRIIAVDKIKSLTDTLINDLKNDLQNELLG